MSGRAAVHNSVITGKKRLRRSWGQGESGKNGNFPLTQGSQVTGGPFSFKRKTLTKKGGIRIWESAPYDCPTQKKGEREGRLLFLCCLGGLLRCAEFGKSKRGVIPLAHPSNLRGCVQSRRGGAFQATKGKGSKRGHDPILLGEGRLRGSSKEKVKKKRKTPLSFLHCFVSLHSGVASVLIRTKRKTETGKRTILPNNGACLGTRSKRAPYGRERGGKRRSPLLAGRKREKDSSGGEKTVRG